MTLSNRRLARRRRAALWLGAIMLLLAVLSVRMLLGARRELRAAGAATEDRARLQHLRRAIAYYLPVNPWLREAKREMITLARRAEREGRVDLALDVWHQLRGSILALRGAYQPFAGELPQINRRIAELSSRHPHAAQHLRGPAGEAALLERLDKPRGPRDGWTALGLLGFLGWCVGGFCLLSAGLRADTSIVIRRFWPLLGAVVAGFALFAVGMAAA